MSNPIFSNKYNVVDTKFKQMVNKWYGFKNDIDDPLLLEEIHYQLGRSYYDDAVQWFKRFKNSTWWRSDLI